MFLFNITLMHKSYSPGECYANAYNVSIYSGIRKILSNHTS